MTTTSIRGYRATREDDGTLIVHRVPIFLECERNGIEFDAKWIRKAVETAKQAEDEGYFPPLHVRHHELSDDVRPAGHFRIVGTEQVRFKGSMVLAIMADLVLTDPRARGEVLSKQLPYRSVEIYDVDVPKIDSLALLDHEAPYLELPMLMVTDVAGAAPHTLKNDVASATFRNPWSKGRVARDERVVACFQRGASVHLLTQEPNMDEDEKKDEEKSTDEKFSVEGEPPVKPEADAEESSSGAPPTAAPAAEEKADDMNVETVVKAIVSGTISVADMDAIMEAIVKQKGRAGASPPVATPAAPAAVPGAALGEAMTKKTDDKKTTMQSGMTPDTAALLGRVDALEANIQERDANDQRKKDVDEALTRLEGRPLGSDLKGRLETFHKNYGGAAFKAYVDSLVESLGRVPADNGRGAMFASQSTGTGASKAAMRYQENGTDAIEKAMSFSREWKQLREAGSKTAEQDYIDINMAKLGYDVPTGAASN